MDKPVGSFEHIALLEKMASAADTQDQKHIEEFWTGLPILGPVTRSGRWPPLDELAEKIIQDITDRAWQIRQPVIERARTDHMAKGDK